MEKHEEFYTDLIARYFYGEATPEEIREIASWVKSDPAHEALFRSFRDTWQLTERQRSDDPATTDREWEALRHRIGLAEALVHQPGPGHRFLMFSLRAAAILVLLAVPTYLLYRWFTPGASVRMAVATETTVVLLPDGTRVTLREGSELSYPETFEGWFREVSLSGEGWFEVAHDRSKPFTVAAGNLRVRAAGTAFLVNTNATGDFSEVILTEGAVRVYTDHNQHSPALLLPGDRAVTTSGGDTLKVSVNTDPNYLAWKTRRLVFDNTPLNQVAALLTKVYGVEVSHSGSGLDACRITATFDQQPLGSVLKVLEATLDIHAGHSGERVILTGPGCTPNH